MAEALVESSRSIGCNVLEIEGSPERKSLCNTLCDAWENGQLSDIVLNARGCDLKVHRLVLLSQCSEIQKDILNTQKKQIDFDVDISALKRAVEFVYINKVVIPEPDVMKVAHVAQVLGIKELWRKCVKALLQSKEDTLENCFKHWDLAMALEDQLLESRVKKFALNNFSRLKRSSDFRALPKQLLKVYLTHPELRIRSEDERLSAALTWVKEDTSDRGSMLHTLLKGFSLHKMGAGFLDHILDDPLILDDAKSKALLQGVLDGISDTDRHKADVPKAIATQKSLKEKCQIIVAPIINYKIVPEVKAVCLSQNFKIVSLCKLPTSFHDKSYVSSCIYRDMIYTSGLGENCDEIWQISTQDWTPSQCGKLSSFRRKHGMAVAEDGRVYIFGGWYINGENTTIEVLDPTTQSVVSAGDLQKADWCNLICLSLGDHVFVCGGSWFGNNAMQVFDVKSVNVKHSVPFPENVGFTLGAVIIKGHLVIVGGESTAVCVTADLLKGKKDTVKIASKYKAPNDRCTMCLSADDSHFVLLGGESKCQQYVYQAPVDDVIHNTGSGWQPVHNTQWSLGGCRIMGGSVTAEIVIPS